MAGINFKLVGALNNNGGVYPILHTVIKRREFLVRSGRPTSHPWVIADLGFVGY